MNRASELSPSRLAGFASDVEQFHVIKTVDFEVLDAITNLFRSQLLSNL
jgi:hypothetical protein